MPATLSPKLGLSFRPSRPGEGLQWRWMGLGDAGTGTRTLAMSQEGAEARHLRLPPPLPRGVGSMPGRALRRHRCPWAGPLLATPPGCQAVRAGPVLLSTERSTMLTASEQQKSLRQL